MASFQKLPFTFLLWNLLSDIQSGAGYLSCSKHNIAELGKPIKITCKNNAPITKIGVTFYPIRGSNYSTKQKENLTAVGKAIQNSTVFLMINQVKTSDEGNYKLTYVADDDMNELDIFLEVFAPYTIPEIRKQEDTLICTSSGGYPEKKLNWISGAGTNLNLNSKSESVKNEGGLYNLSNILQLESAPSETEYCCTFNNTKVSRRQQDLACMTLENVTTLLVTAENTTLKTTGILIFFIIIIILVSTLSAVFCYRKSKKMHLLQEEFPL